MQYPYSQRMGIIITNGGVNFTPTEYQIVFNRGGDPRWLPETATATD